MSSKYYCNHIENIHEIPVHQLPKDTTCNDCDCIGPNLWLCLHKDCLHVGCSEKFNDHSTIHYKNNEEHCVHINLSTKRIWCYICETEVYFRTRSIVYEVSDNEDQRETNISVNAPLLNKHKTSNVQMVFTGDSGDENHSSDSDDLSELASIASNKTYSKSNGDKYRGLVGLQNIGNTCYMNSALQALSNTLPLTSYFLECGVALQIVSDNKKPGLSRTYQQLMREIWNKRTRGYVVPSGILYGIRNVYPMFRGYHQHDTQEFLRCFMDQLHEELKEPDNISHNNILSTVTVTSSTTDRHRQQQQSTTTSSIDYWRRDSPSPSQSDGEYETCDSGVSERSSLSDDTERSSSNNNPNNNNNSSVNKRKLSVTESSCSSSVTSRCKYNNVIDTQPSGGSSGAVSEINKNHKGNTRYRSIISDIFDGKLLSSVQCLTCDRISTRVETFQDLSLPIPGRDHITMLHQNGPKAVSSMLNAKSLGDGSLPAGLVTCADTAVRDGWWSLGWLWGWLRSWFYGPAVSLHDCLAAFFSADELKGDNMYSCEKCNKLRNGVKFSKVIELPEVLCIHLKRFRHELMFSSKISNYVSFPMSGLDMRPYLHRDCVSEVCEYDLNSVICHHGTAGAGHYTCYALNHQRNTWFEFDDQCVTEVSPETVESCEAYVLFYRKSSRKIHPIRQSVSDLMEMQGAGDMRFYISRQWFTRFSTCAEPGPIDNTDFLCLHGAVKPNKMPFVDKLSVVVSQPVYEFLLKTFRGGPTCNHLYECPICSKQAEAHLRRIHFELETFVLLNKKFQQQSLSGRDECLVAIYAISMKWLRSWQAFVKNQTEEPPGAIDNTSIVIPGTNTVNLSSDYAQISEELWMFLYRIYGGGPIIQLRSGAVKEVPNSSTPTVLLQAESIQSLPKQQQQQQPEENNEENTAESTSFIPPITAITSVSTSDSEDFDDEQYITNTSTTNSNINSPSPPPSIKQQQSTPVNTFANPPSTQVIASELIPGTKRPPRVYSLHNDKSAAYHRRRRRGGDQASSQSSHHADEHHVHGKFNKYNNTTKRRLALKKRNTYYRRNSDDNIVASSKGVTATNNYNGQ